MSISLTIKTLIGIEVTPEILMERYAETGDAKVLSQLYDACADDLFHFLVTHSDYTLAKDVAQKTWLKIIEKRHLYRPSGRFKPWLFTIARRTLLDEFRAQSKCVELDQLSLHTTTPNMTAEKIEERFDQVLMQLPFVQREAFCLQQEGFSLKEISEITSTSAETIKTRIRYARKTLRDALENIHE
ncbi:sigma-70 family RNA polymerase sigma factor [Aestuariibacter sp. AA17]|uniref:Sigma-70 family RNA polymerase sigma factor n=1 Tax=Fluctibacter corallii TaxID=2984329 RepID=A0ABT3AAN6_9ALTE|nr:sigma-70 family RNA polymerase sigma factor [Aestuariibacter sp. AA17]MCV2885724.1 sigma-70 family RNA polymerase sigma factor [Aestuariibacter sp. AA17]